MSPNNSRQGRSAKDEHLGTYLMSDIVEDVGHVSQVRRGEYRIEHLPLALVLRSSSRQEAGAEEKMKIAMTRVRLSGIRKHFGGACTRYELSFLARIRYL